MRKTAQRRPGREPRRHPPDGVLDDPIWMHAQRRPGREPRRHSRSSSAAAPDPGPLNEGRGANPGDTADTGDVQRTLSALNEGRGANPGDTAPGAEYRPAPHRAQRRPGREPRRHRIDSGAVTRSRRCAQRRPGREPRRHRRNVRAAHPYRHRSTKAGARTPATPRELRVALLVHHRSTKAGARTPATPGSARADRAR